MTDHYAIATMATVNGMAKPLIGDPHIRTIGDPNLIGDPNTIGNPNILIAVDPMALILSGSAYVKWVEQKNPHGPNAASVRAAARGMTAQERKATLGRAKSLIEYGKAVEEALAK